MHFVIHCWELQCDDSSLWVINITMTDSVSSWTDINVQISGFQPIFNPTTATVPFFFGKPSSLNVKHNGVIRVGNSGRDLRVND